MKKRFSLSPCLSVCLSVCLSFSLSLSASLVSLSLSLSLSVCLSVWLSLSVCLFVCLCVSISLSLSLSQSLSRSLVFFCVLSLSPSSKTCTFFLPQESVLVQILVQLLKYKLHQKTIEIGPLQNLWFKNLHFPLESTDLSTDFGGTGFENIGSCVKKQNLEVQVS